MNLGTIRQTGSLYDVEIYAECPTCRARQWISQEHIRRGLVWICEGEGNEFRLTNRLGGRHRHRAREYLVNDCKRSKAMA